MWVGSDYYLIFGHEVWDEYKWFAGSSCKLTPPTKTGNFICFPGFHTLLLLPASDHQSEVDDAFLFYDYSVSQ